MSKELISREQQITTACSAMHDGSAALYEALIDNENTEAMEIIVVLLDNLKVIKDNLIK